MNKPAECCFCSACTTLERYRDWLGSRPGMTRTPSEDPSAQPLSHTSPSSVTNQGPTGRGTDKPSLLFEFLIHRICELKQVVSEAKYLGPFSRSSGNWNKRFQSLWCILSTCFPGGVEQFGLPHRAHESSHFTHTDVFQSSFLCSFLLWKMKIHKKTNKTNNSIWTKAEGPNTQHQ